MDLYDSTDSILLSFLCLMTFLASSTAGFPLRTYFGRFLETTTSLRFLAARMESRRFRTGALSSFVCAERYPMERHSRSRHPTIRRRMERRRSLWYVSVLLIGIRHNICIRIGSYNTETAETLRGKNGAWRRRISRLYSVSFLEYPRHFSTTAAKSSGSSDSKRISLPVIGCLKPSDLACSA